MRALAHQATPNGDAILLLDFANAFNSADRNLMISLSARMYPQLTNLTWSFISEFDSTLQSAFETLRELYISDKIYRIANLSSKHGGIRLEDGISHLLDALTYIPSKKRHPH